MTGEPEVDRLARDFPSWRIWRNDRGEVLAWWLGTKPPVLLRAPGVPELRRAIERKVTRR